MARLPRYSPLGVSIASVPGLPTVDYTAAASAEARGYESLSRALDKVSQFAFEKASQQRKLEWQEAGLMAPENVLEQLSGKKLSEMSAAEREGYRVASDVFGSEIDFRARKELGQIALRGEYEKKSAQEIDAEMSIAIAGYSEAAGMLSREQQIKVSRSLQSVRETAFLKSSEREMKLLEAEHRAAGLEGLELYQQEMEDVARIGKGNFDEILADRKNELGVFLKAHGFSPEEITRQQITLENSGRKARLRGLFGRAETLTGKRSFVEQIKRDLESGGPLTSGLDDDAVRTVISQFNSEIASAQSQLGPQLSLTREKIARDITAVIKKGSEPNPAVIAETRKQLLELADSGLNVEKDLRNLDNASADAAFFGAIKLSSLPEKEQILADLLQKTRDGATGQQARQIEILQSSIKSQRTTLKNDPVSWGKQIGAISEDNLFVAMSATEPEKRQNLIDERVKRAEGFAIRQGISPQYLSKTEADYLSAQFSNADDAGRKNLLYQINSGFGSKSYEVYKQISKEAPILAHIGGMIQSQQKYGDIGSELTIERALRGMRLMEVNADIKQFYNGPSFKEAGLTLFSAFNRMPKTKGNMIEASAAIYAGSDHDTKTATSDDWRSAIQDAAGRVRNADGKDYGGIVKYNGAYVVIPSSIRQKGDLDLEAVMDKSKPEFLTDYRDRMGPLDPNGKPLDIKKLIDNNDIILRSVHDGLVQVSFRNNGNEMYALNKAGSIFTLDLRSLSEAVSSLGR